MQHLLIWFQVNGLLTHTKKTTAMSFHTSQNKGALKSQIISEGMDIKYKYETNFWVDIWLKI